MHMKLRYCPDETVAAEATVNGRRILPWITSGIIQNPHSHIHTCKQANTHSHIKTRVPGAGRLWNPSSGPVRWQHLAHICLKRIYLHLSCFSYQCSYTWRWIKLTPVWPSNYNFSLCVWYYILAYYWRLAAVFSMWKNIQIKCLCILCI